MVESGRILSNSQIVALAVAKLGGAAKEIDIEDIAIEAYGLAPEKFAWRKYPEYIDLRVVQYALKDAASPHKGKPLLRGSLKHGYMLTPFGLGWIEQRESLSISAVQAMSRRQSTADKLSIEEARLLTSSAFLKFTSGKAKEISYSDFQDFARVNDYFPVRVRQRRYVVIQNAVRGNDKLEELWSFLLDKFGKDGI